MRACVCAHCHVAAPQAQPGDYLSKVARRAGIKIEQFVQDNVQQLDDLSKPVAGKDLLVCPKGAVSTPASEWIDPSGC